MPGEKAKEQREASERDSRNREYAGSSYHVPRPDDLVDDEEVSGLPWGGISSTYSPRPPPSDHWEPKS